MTKKKGIESECIAGSVWKKKKKQMQQGNNDAACFSKVELRPFRSNNQLHLVLLKTHYSLLFLFLSPFGSNVINFPFFHNRAPLTLISNWKGYEKNSRIVYVYVEPRKYRYCKEFGWKKRRKKILWGQKQKVRRFVYLRARKSLGAAHWVAQCWRWKTREVAEFSQKLYIYQRRGHKLIRMIYLFPSRLIFLNRILGEKHGKPLEQI